MFLTHKSVFVLSWLLLPSVVEPSEDRVQHIASNITVASWMCCCFDMFHTTLQIQRAAPTVFGNTHVILRLLLGYVTDHMWDKEGVVIVVYKNSLDISSADCVQCQCIALFLECFSFYTFWFSWLIIFCVQSGGECLWDLLFSKFNVSSYVCCYVFDCCIVNRLPSPSPPLH